MIKNVVFDLGGVVLGRSYGRDGHRMARFSFLQGDRPFPEFWKRFDRGEATWREVAEGIARTENCTVEEAEYGGKSLMGSSSESGAYGGKPLMESSTEEGVYGRKSLMGCSTDEAGGELERIMRMFDEFPRTVELIRELSGRGYGLYVLSNMPLEFYEHMRRTFDVFGYFDGVVISSLEKMAKPDPRFFGILTERYGLIPEETLFVDDKATNTGAAARLGFHVCEFDTETGPDEVRSMLGIE